MGEITLNYGDAIRVRSRAKHYRIREYLTKKGVNVQGSEWCYDEHTDIGFGTGGSPVIIGWKEGCAYNYLTESEFFSRLGVGPRTSHEGSTLVFNFIK